MKNPVHTAVSECCKLRPSVDISTTGASTAQDDLSFTFRDGAGNKAHNRACNSCNRACNRSKAPAEPASSSVCVCVACLETRAALSSMQISVFCAAIGSI